MRVAIPSDDEYISTHFGRCPYYTIIDVVEDKITNKEIIENPGHHPEYLPQFLNKKGVDVIISGGMGRKAQSLFREADIDIVLGINGLIDEIIQRLINGSLKGKENPCKPGEGKGYGKEKTEKFNRSNR